MKIRTAGEDDAKLIMKFELKLFRKWDLMDPIDKIDESWFNSENHLERTLRTIKDFSKRIFLVFEGEKCAGYLKAEIKEREPFLKKTGYISETYILEGYRNRHIATLLLDKAIEWFRKNNISWTTVSTHSLDREAVRFWEKKGYKEYNKFFKRKI